jgi:acetolactate synthase small subunit
MRASIFFILFLCNSLSQFAFGQCTGTPIEDFLVTNLVNVSCNEEEDGEIEVTLTGGEAPFTYYLGIETGGGEIPILEIQNTTDKTVTFTGLFPNEGFGSYKVRIVTSNGGTPTSVCSRRAITGLDITQPDPLEAEATVTDECTGANSGEIELSISGGTAPYAVSWSGPTAIPDDETNPTGLSPGTYEASITDDLGCTTDLSADIEQRPDATLSALGPTTICLKETSTLQVAINNGVAPYTVAIDTTGSNLIKTITNYTAGDAILIKPNADATYSLVSVTDGEGCDAAVSGSENITVIPQPTASAGSDEAVCSTETLDLSASVSPPTASDFSSLSWTTSGSGAFNDINALTPIYTPSAADITSGSVILTLTANGNASCAPASDAMTLNITQAPTANAGNDEAVCQGDDLDLSTSTTPPSASDFSILLWSSSGSGAFSDAAALAPVYTPSAADIASGSVTLTLTANGNGSCAAATDNMVLTLAEPPTASAGSDEAVCSTETLDLSASVSPPTASDFSSLSWTTSGSGAFNDINALTPIYTPSAADITSGSVILTLTANGNASCAPASDAMTLNITQAPTANAGNDEAVCQGDDLDLSTSTTPPSASDFSILLWSSSGSGAFSDAAALAPVYTPSAADIASGSVTLTLTANGNGSCAAATDNMVLTLAEPPTASAGSDEAVCSTETLDLSASVSPPTASDFSSLSWTTSGSGAFNDINALTPIYTPSAADITSGSVILTLTANGNASCAPASDAMTLNITQAPTANAGNDEAVCQGDDLDLSTSTTPPSASDFSSLLWSSSGNGTFSDAAALAPVYTPSAADISNGSVTLTLTANGNGSCAAATDNMVLTLAEPPTASAGSDEAVCSTETLDLSASVSPPTASDFSSLSWTTSGSGAFNDINALTPIYTPSAADITSGICDLDAHSKWQCLMCTGI